MSEHMPGPPPPPPAMGAPPPRAGKTISRKQSQPGRVSKRPSTAPENARWDLDTYREYCNLYQQRAGRSFIAVIALTTLTAVIGAFTALLDEAVLGAVSGSFAAVAAGVETWRTHGKLDAHVLAYRTAFVDVEAELDLFTNGGGEYATLAGEKDKDLKARRRRLLSERLAEITKRTEAATK